MLSQPWRASVKWYLNNVLALMGKQSIKKAQENAQSKQLVILRGLTYVGIIVSAGLLVFLYWLWICLRVPTQYQPLQESILVVANHQKPVLLRHPTISDVQITAAQITAAQITAAQITAAQITAGSDHAFADYPVKKESKSLQYTQPRIKLEDRMQKKWGVLQIMNRAPTQKVHEVSMSEDVDEGCEDIAICTININSDVLIAERE